jgi:hypothetical protein
MFSPMKKIFLHDNNCGHSSNAYAQPGRENNWCEKYGYFIDLDACQARSMNRPVCRRCYKSLLQLSLPFNN